MRKFPGKFAEKMKAHILCPIIFLLKSCLLRDNVKKYGRARQATDYNIIWSMRVACPIATTTEKRSCI